MEELWYGEAIIGTSIISRRSMFSDLGSMWNMPGGILIILAWGNVDTCLKMVSPGDSLEHTDEGMSTVLGQIHMSNTGDQVDSTCVWWTTGEEVFQYASHSLSRPFIGLANKAKESEPPKGIRLHIAAYSIWIHLQCQSCHTKRLKCYLKDIAKKGHQDLWKEIHTTTRWKVVWPWTRRSCM